MKKLKAKKLKGLNQKAGHDRAEAELHKIPNLRSQISHLKSQT
jgi:hypothetical protein